MEFGYFEDHLPVAILQQYQDIFMPATILKVNFIVTILEQLFFKTPLGGCCCYILLIQFYESDLQKVTKYIKIR